MQLIDQIKRGLKTALMKQVSNLDIEMESRKRFGKLASDGVVPLFIPERRITLQEWQNSIDMAMNPYTLQRREYYRIARNTMLDLHLTSIIETRLLSLQGSKFKLMDRSGKEDQRAVEMLQCDWYNDWIDHSWSSYLYGHSLVELFEQKDQAITTKLNGGNATYKPLKDISLIPRDHVRPEEGKWLINSMDVPGTGFDYTMPPMTDYYISVGKKDSLGLLVKVAPVALAKRYAIGAWGDFDEKLGIPFRTVTMKTPDKRREQLLAEIMTNMGPAGWAILHENEKIELLQNTGSDVHKCFLELGNFCDMQMSKAVLGSTLTVDAEGGKYKGDVHAQTTQIRHEADKTFIEYQNNEKLIPLLVRRGYPLEGYRYAQNTKKDLSVTEQIEVDTVLLQHYNIDPKYIAGKYDIPEDQITGKSPENVQDLITEKQKKKPQIKNSNLFASAFESSIINSCERLYFSGCSHNHSEVKAASSSLYDGIGRVIKSIYNNEIKKGDLDAGLYNWQVDQLIKGLQEGYGKDFNDIDYNTPDGGMVKAIQKNVFVFGAFKNYQELRAMSDQLLDENGNQKTYAQFKKDTMALHETYDDRFGRAEFQNAVVSAKAMSMWQDFQSEKTNFPLLRYNAILDGGTTQLCRDLDGTTLPVDDEFWTRYFLPNHWGERSTIDQVASGEQTDKSKLSLPDIKPMFDNNVGVSGIVFPSKHPYFEASKEQKKINNKFAKDQFKKRDGKF